VNHVMFSIQILTYILNLCITYYKKVLKNTWDFLMNELLLLKKFIM